MTDKDNYLKCELYALVRSDPSIFEFLQKGSLDGLWYWDLETPENEWLSPRFWEILGYDPALRQHLASEWQELIHPDDLATALTNLKAHCADPGHPYDQLVRYRHADGSTVWVRCRGMAVRDATGKPVRMLGAHNEVTGLKNAEVRLKEQAEALRQANAELQRLATRDGLTDLFNRRAFDEHLKWSVNNALRRHESLSVMLVDLDHFKDVNDTLGHRRGDAVLVTAARALQAAVRANDYPARYGGEEFAIVLPQTDEPASLTVGEKVRGGIEQDAQDEHRVTASVGIATVEAGVGAGARSASGLASRVMTEADRALYQAKRRGRNQVCHFRQA